MGARLVGGGSDRAEIRLARGRITIGSADDNRVVLGDTTISRRHATLEIDGDSCTAADAGSTNGTFVNGQRITDATPVHEGDELRFGALKFVFHADAPPEARTARTSHGGTILPLIGPIILLLFVGAAVTSLFVINFSRLEIAGLASTTAASPTVSDAAAESTAAPSWSKDHGPKPWLEALNRYRAMAGVPEAHSNYSLSSGAALHSRYLARNYNEQIRHNVNLGGVMHQEDPSKPGFTPEGAAAGLAGDVDEMWDPGAAHEVSWAIDDWMLGPFHRLSLLDPRLRSAGYGDYCEAGVCIATLNAHSDIVAMASLAKDSATPVEYPPNGSVIKGVDLTTEWPDPLTSCSGYAPPAGLPITIQFGPFVTPIIDSFSLTLDSDPPVIVEACGIDATSYSNPDTATQSVARELLREYGAVIIIPHKSLAPGRYTVALKNNRQDYTWSFTVKP